MGIQDIKLNDVNVFPAEWTTSRTPKPSRGFQGWFFYALYVFALGLITVLIIINFINGR